MAKFNVGDKVRVRRCSDFDDHRPHWGKVYEVSKVSEIETYTLRGAEGSAFWEHHIELAVQPSELEQLVATVNAGRRAMDKLVVDYADQIIYVDEKRIEDSYVIESKNGIGATHVIGSEIQIKRRPPFEPFTVGQGWRVELVGTDRVRVGCQEFPIKQLKSCLEDLCNDNCMGSGMSEVQLSASRAGASYRNHLISWEDADRLLAALKKVEGAR